MSAMSTGSDRAGVVGAAVAALGLLGCGIGVLAQAQAPAQAAATGPAAGGDAHRGQGVYQVCTACHSLDEDDVGPRHRGVVGRLAGSVPGFAYSAALKNSHLQWTPQNLDRWLANPSALVPGTRMFFALSDPTDRADVIAWLATQR
ncbi:MAG: c-type cytochrome [Steroidobacteraceae bacterium]